MKNDHLVSQRLSKSVVEEAEKLAEGSSLSIHKGGQVKWQILNVGGVEPRDRIIVVEEWFKDTPNSRENTTGSNFTRKGIRNPVTAKKS